VSLPNRDKLAMRVTVLMTLRLILSLSKDEAKISAFSASCAPIMSLSSTALQCAEKL